MLGTYINARQKEEHSRLGKGKSGITLVGKYLGKQLRGLGTRHLTFAFSTVLSSLYIHTNESRWMLLRSNDSMKVKNKNFFYISTP